MSRKIWQHICANCKHSFQEGENFCPNCGQDNHSPNQPIKHYTAELIESLLHLDSKILLTLKTMLMYPGKITREYNENMRARYTPPICLYVFISLIFFVLIQYLSTNNKNFHILKPNEHELQDSLQNKNPTINTINNPKQDTLQDSMVVENIGAMTFKMSKDEIAQYKNAKPEQLDSIIIKNHSTPNYFTRTLYRQIIKSVNKDEDEDFKKSITEKSIKFGSFALFLLMPFFGFLIFLSYFRRKKFYYEYLIFSIHYHTVVFLILSLTIAVNIFVNLPTWVYWIVFFGLLFYLGKALRFNYQGNRKRTILKMFFICSVYSIVLLFVAFGVVVLGWWFV